MTHLLFIMIKCHWLCWLILHCLVDCIHPAIISCTITDLSFTSTHHYQHHHRLIIIIDLSPSSMLRYHFYRGSSDCVYYRSRNEVQFYRHSELFAIIIFLAIMHQLYFFSLCCQGSQLETIILRFSCRDNSLYNSLAMAMECTEPKESCQLLRLWNKFNLSKS